MRSMENRNCWRNIVKIIFKIFFNFFFRKISFAKIFLSNFFCENFSFYKNTSAKIFFTIFSRISFVFDVCEIMYFAKLFIRNFAHCDFLCFAILVYGKKNFFCDFFFSDEREYQIWKCLFSDKRKIFSDRTFGFLYSLLGK